VGSTPAERTICNFVLRMFRRTFYYVYRKRILIDRAEYLL